MLRTIPERIRRSRGSALGVAGAQESPAVRVLLYDADGEDRELALSEIDLAALDEKGLLWVDVCGLDELERAATRLSLPSGAGAAIADAPPRAGVVFNTGHFHVSVVVARRTPAGYEPAVLHCVAGDNWIVTAHEAPLDFLERFRGQIRGDSGLGRLDAAGLVAVFLHEQVASYVREIEPFEIELERLDVQVMTGRADDTAVLQQLVAVRRGLARLRRLLAPHRELYARLARPDFELLSDSESREGFASLAERSDQALQALDAAREMTVSSFEIYTTWTSHETNKVMKMLTVASVALLPPTFLASVMGMNSLPAALSGGQAFAITLSLMLVLLAAVLATARRRRWI